MEWIYYLYHTFYCQTKGTLKSTILGVGQLYCNSYKILHPLVQIEFQQVRGKDEFRKQNILWEKCYLPPGSMAYNMLSSYKFCMSEKKMLLCWAHICKIFATYMKSICHTYRKYLPPIWNVLLSLTCILLPDQTLVQMNSEKDNSGRGSFIATHIRFCIHQWKQSFSKKGEKTNSESRKFCGKNAAYCQAPWPHSMLSSCRFSMCERKSCSCAEPLLRTFSFNGTYNEGVFTY